MDASIPALLAFVLLGDNIILDSQRNYVGMRCTTSRLVLHLSVDSSLPCGGQDPLQPKLSGGESKGFILIRSLFIALKWSAKNIDLPFMRWLANMSIRFIVILPFISLLLSAR